MSNPNYLDFTEERLELGIDYGVVGGPGFKTEIIETSDGREQRNSLWWLPLGRWQLGDRMVAESQREMMSEVSYLKQFHADRKGSKQGFRFRDWADYYVVGQEIGIGDGIQTQWQLKKTYWAGNNYCDRPILKPVDNSIVIYLDGYISVNWTIDISSGLLQFDNPPAVDVVITADFEFDVPVCFETDEIGFNLQGYEDLGDGEYDAIYRLESLFVEEIRINPSLPWAIEPQPEQLDETLDLGIVYETIESTRFDTSKEQLASGFARRDNNYPVAKTEIKLGNRILDREELDRLLGFFWCAKGSRAKFKYKDFLVNFNQDILTAKFDGKENNYFLFTVNNIQLIGCHYYQEDFSFNAPNKNILYNFTFTVSNSNVPDTAAIYLIKGAWDSQGSIGLLSTGDIDNNFNGVGFNREYNQKWVNNYGFGWFVGIGNSVSGTVIEDESNNPQTDSASCSLTLLFIW